MTMTSITIMLNMSEPASTIGVRKAIVQYNKVHRALKQMTVYEQMVALENAWNVVKDEYQEYVLEGGKKELIYHDKGTISFPC